MQGALEVRLYAYARLGEAIKLQGKLWVNPHDWEQGPDHVGTLRVYDMDAKLAAGDYKSPLEQWLEEAGHDE